MWELQVSAEFSVVGTCLAPNCPRTILENVNSLGVPGKYNLIMYTFLKIFLKYICSVHVRMCVHAHVLARVP